MEHFPRCFPFAEGADFTQGDHANSRIGVGDPEINELKSYAISIQMESENEGKFADAQYDALNLLLKDATWIQSDLGDLGLPVLAGSS